jgi:DNA-binding NarL/FixJ family response regulator
LQSEKHCIDGQISSPTNPGEVPRLSAVVRSVLLVGFPPLERDGLRVALEARGVAVSPDAPVAGDAVGHAEPVDVAIVDFAASERLPDGTPFPAAAVVAELATPARRIVAVVADASRTTDLGTFGIDTVIDRRTRLDALLTAVLHRRDPGLPWSIPTVRALPLTKREREVLQLIAGGCTSKEIAGTLGVSSHTVESHKQRVFRRLGVQNQAQAIAAAMRMGLLDPQSARGVSS